MTYHYRFWKSEGEYRYALPGLKKSLFIRWIEGEYVGTAGDLEQYIILTNEFSELIHESWDNLHEIRTGETIVVKGSKVKVLEMYTSADGAIEVVTNQRTSVIDSEASIESKVKALAALELHKERESMKGTGHIVPIESPKKKRRWWFW